MKRQIVNLPHFFCAEFGQELTFTLSPKPPITPCLQTMIENHPPPGLVNPIEIASMFFSKGLWTQVKNLPLDVTAAGSIQLSVCRESACLPEVAKLLRLESLGHDPFKLMLRNVDQRFWNLFFGQTISEGAITCCDSSWLPHISFPVFRNEIGWNENNLKSNYGFMNNYFLIFLVLKPLLDDILNLWQIRSWKNMSLHLLTPN